MDRRLGSGWTAVTQIHSFTFTAIATILHTSSELTKRNLNRNYKHQPPFPPTNVFTKILVTQRTTSYSSVVIEKEISYLIHGLHSKCARVLVNITLTNKGLYSFIHASLIRISHITCKRWPSSQLTNSFHAPPWRGSARLTKSHTRETLFFQISTWTYLTFLSTSPLPMSSIIFHNSVLELKIERKSQNL